MPDVILGTNKPVSEIPRGGDGTHIFDTEALRGALEKSIGNLGPNDTGAIVAAADKNGTHVAIEVSKVNHYGTWAIDAVYEHDWNGNDTAAGSVMFRW